MANSSLEVAAGVSIVALLTMAAAFGQSGAPRPWAQTLVGEPYRHQVREVKLPVPAAVRRAVPVAWAVVVVCALEALVLLLQIVLLEKVKGAATVNCATFPCEPPPFVDVGPSFDVPSAALHGVALIATAAAIGAFARWAKEAAKDMTQCRRWAPVIAGAVLVGVALAVPPLLQLRELQLGQGIHHPASPDVVGLFNGFEIALVLLGAAMVAVARRSAAPPAAG